MDYPTYFGILSLLSPSSLFNLLLLALLVLLLHLLHLLHLLIFFQFHVIQSMKRGGGNSLSLVLLSFQFAPQDLVSLTTKIRKENGHITQK